MLSDDDGIVSSLEFGLEGNKPWTTVEDEDMGRIEALAAELRDRPLLPPFPGDASRPWTDVTSGVAFPTCHCAIRECAGVSDRMPCMQRSASTNLWIGHEGCWTREVQCMRHASGLYGCCEDAACLRQHLVDSHAELFLRVCGFAASQSDSYSYYLEAIALREQQTMPKVGPSVDRRTFRHVAADLSDSATQSLICMCCARVALSYNGKTHVAFIPAGQYFDKISSQIFRLNWCIEEYTKRYARTETMRDHPELDSTCWTWRRRLGEMRRRNQVILCCPEDAQCDKGHEQHVLCRSCLIPLCHQCLTISNVTEEAKVGIPEALANDNFWGYVTSLLYKYRVRWIEAAAACPVFTALITYYVEGDRGHLLNAEEHRPQRAYAVRGNVYSFHMPWEEIARKLDKVLEAEDTVSLPHPPETLASVVLFSLRIGDVVDLNKWLPQAKLRPHVVLKLLCALVDNRYPFPRGGPDAETLKKHFATLLARRYPETESHLPEDEREGSIPEAVASAMREALRPAPGEKETSVKQKHATPVATSQAIAVALNEVRPSAVFPDRTSSNIVPRDVRELLALRKHYELAVSTGKALVDQWRSSYFAIAFPFSIPRPVSGADFPRKCRERRSYSDAPLLDPLAFARMLSSRVEASVRNDWLAVPAARNLGIKWKALCGDDAACRHHVDMQKAGVELSAELTDAASDLYEKLSKGFWWDGRKKRKINHDVTKLQYAVNLSPAERDLVRDMTFLSSTVAGTQQIRLEIGHALFGARVEFGDPLFLTISPSSRHSGMCVRLSRYRSSDPAILCDKAPSTSVPAWAGASAPKIWKEQSGNAVIMDLPPYTLRRIIVARDPWAVMQNFELSIKYVLPRLTGLRMCVDCPNCNTDESTQPCANIFGHNMMPMGGVLGLGMALGGSVEYQGNDNPHFHGNLHLASVYQYKTLMEIAEMMESNVLQLADITSFQEWTCREDHFDLEGHNAALDVFEKKWNANNSDASCDDLCRLPLYLREDTTRSLWSATDALDINEALLDGDAYKKVYFADAQYVFSHCHHHWHPFDPKSKERHPIRGCRSKKDGRCKARFPHRRRLSLKPKVVCPGNARRHDLRVSGRRNALGSILSTRRCPWSSGTTPSFAVVFRDNTHTGPNYRVPLLRQTHDPECTGECLTNHTLRRMTVAAQRAQRNTTGYYTGYIQKRQPVGKFELRQAAMNLKFLQKTIEHRSNPQQYHHVANRLLGDLEYRGHVRPATEEFNLAGNHKEKDLMSAEFIRTFPTQAFYGGDLLRRLRDMTSARSAEKELAP